MQRRRLYRSMRTTAVTLLLASGPGMVNAAVTAPIPRPIVLELYTSEGCSSCPPAEKLIAGLAQRGDLLVLGYHVDYWDALGWRDRFSLPAATERQRRWVEANDSRGAYTPQLIVDGRHGVIGSDAPAVAAALRDARTRIDVAAPQAFTAVISAGQLLIDAPATPSTNALDLYAIAYLPRAITTVPRGENAGRTLIETNVVRSISRLGSLANGAAHWRIALNSFPAEASRVAVVLQDASTGAISGAQALALH